ncbi:MAG: 16S rRNA (uracil(1498)-N(3))-methyltransferase [Betaproteobacteria bacterium]|nr:16S rRNA (uracil(1498)-N(3))-methyltransferase [Betaproteobacteria bacterium]
MDKDLDRKLTAKSGARFHFEGKLGNGSEVRLHPAAAHHAVRVLRLAVGEPVVMFDGLGGEFEARITRIDRGDVSVKTGAHLDVERESRLHVRLVQGLSSGDRMDITLQKAVELGVAAIQPVATERSVVKLKDERAQRRVEHWQNLVISACEQCGRNRVPEVSPLMSLPDWLAQLDMPAADDEARLLLSPTASVPLKALAPKARMTLLIGPEGGLSPVENQLAQSRWFRQVRLGPRILRTETAALAALSAIQALWGDF